jgi:Lipid desaturase domain
MKLLFFAAAAAAAALVPAAVAFSSSSTSRTTRRQKPTSFASLHHERAPLSTITSLQSSFVKETTTLSTADFNLDTTDDSPTVAATLQQPSLQQKRSYLDDGFVFGLEGSGLDRPKGKVSQLVVEGDSLETTNWQRAVVWGTMLGHAGFLATAFAEMLQVNQGNVAWTMMQSVLLVISSWILADFGSGVLHWSVDNYGNGRTPIMGGIIAAFQGHHSARKLEC